MVSVCGGVEFCLRSVMVSCSEVVVPFGPDKVVSGCWDVVFWCRWMVVVVSREGVVAGC